MKKKVLICALVGVGSLYACKKSDHSANVQSQSELMNTQILSMIEINSADDLEQFYNDEIFRSSVIEDANYTPLSNNIDALDQLVEEGDSLGFWSSPYLRDTIFQDYGPLLQLLNSDRLVKLGDYIVKVDLNQEQVLLSSIEAAGDVQTAINEINAVDFNADIVQVFNTEVEVVPLIFNLFRCKDDFAKRNKDNAKEAKCNNNYRTYKKVSYQAAGIYFSLVAEAKNQQKFWYTLGQWVKWNGTAPNMYMNMYYKQRCDDAGSWWSGEASTWIHANISHSSNSHKATFRPYDSWKALTSYFFSASIHGSCGVDYLEIQDNM